MRSVRATGSWTPDSRIALASAVGPDFGDRWEAMARTSFAMYMSYLGTAGNRSIGGRIGTFYRMDRGPEGNARARERMTFFPFRIGLRTLRRGITARLAAGNASISDEECLADDFVEFLMLGGLCAAVYGGFSSGWGDD